jgi:hypothetical protein
VSEITLANNEKLLAARKGKYALLAQPDHDAALRKVLAGGKNIVAASKPLHGWLAETTYSLVLTPRGLKEARDEWRKQLDQAQKLLPQEARFVLPLLDGLGQLLKSDEVTQLGLGARLDPAGNTTICSKALFKEGGDFARAAGKVKGLSGGPLHGLPAGPFALASGGPAPPELMRTLTDLKVQMLKATAANPDPNSIRQLEKSSQEMMKGVEGLSCRLGRGKKGEPLLASLVCVLHVPDSAAFLTDFEKAARPLGAAVKDLKSSVLSALEARKGKTGDRSLLEVDIQMGKGKELGAEKLLEGIFGPEGKVTARLVPAGNRTVVLGFRPAEELLKLFPGDADREFTSDPQVAKTVKLLPQGAQWALLYDIQGVMELIDRFLTTPTGKQWGDAPPVGFAVRVSEAGAEWEMMMPASIWEAFKPVPQPGEPKKDAPLRKDDR